jgi:hypothetical protein
MQHVWVFCHSWCGGVWVKGQERVDLLTPKSIILGDVVISTFWQNFIQIRCGVLELSWPQTNRRGWVKGHEWVDRLTPYMKHFEDQEH